MIVANSLFPDSWGALHLWPLAAGLLALALLSLIWSYGRLRTAAGLKYLLVSLKLAGVLLLAVCLLEPLKTENRPATGKNLLVIAADTSRSMQIADAPRGKTRAERVADVMQPGQPWLAQLEEDFDLRKYAFGTRIQSWNDPLPDDFSDTQTALRTTIENLGSTYQRDGMAGLLLFTDGISTEQLDALDWEQLPTIYPVPLGAAARQKDVQIVRTTVNQSNFETTPVSVSIELMTSGFQGQDIEVQLLEGNAPDGQLIEQRTVRNVKDGRSFAVRFDVKPDQQGVNHYRVRAFAGGNAELKAGSEITLVNNQRQFVINRARGPFRILYVSGRPNWEFKFLRRALAEDAEIELVGLIRVARKEPKFTFQSRRGERTNPLYRGFENTDEEQTEQYDQAVMMRVGGKDPEELRGGFPQSEDEMFQYDAVVLDDVEAGFFTQNQMSLLQKFVASRGGGFAMLGGQESFVKGKYDRTPIGEMLPVYVNRFTPSERAVTYRLNLTREGWIQPWVRVRSTRQAEQQRLLDMPEFNTINRVNTIKPGASVLAEVSTDEEPLPALVVQRFGRGKSIALLIGDFWRWQLQNDIGNNDMLTAWRQMMRWLVSDVPRRVETLVERDPGSQQFRLIARVNDASFAPLGNAEVQFEIQTSTGETMNLRARESANEIGKYEATLVPREPGFYTAQATIRTTAGEALQSNPLGLVSAPEIEEFQQSHANRQLLEKIAEKTGGEIVDIDRLDSFVNSLADRDIPYVQKVQVPWWHQWSVFAAALSLLIGEWGLRRWKGLA